ncbi:MFS transporter [Nonomuraea sp. NPDC049028]|uniref:MFS transporter n=1 Tax=Nonomuraea sp. NPDC049028 TaxID=3364348 RepID=UPI003724C4DB
MLIDRFDARRVLIGTYVLRMLAFAFYPLVGWFGPLIAIGDRAYYPASGSYIFVLAEGAARDQLYTLMATTRNAAFGLGGLLSAGAVSLAGETGFAVIAFTNAASFAVAAGCLALPRQQTAAAPGIWQPGGYRQVFADRLFIGLVVAEQAFTLIHLILPVAMPVYAVTVLGVSLAWLGILYTINTILVAAGQLAVRRWQRHARRTHAMALSGVVMMAACAGFGAVVLLPAGPARVAGLVAATLLLTLGELMHTTPSWTIAAGAAIWRSTSRPGRCQPSSRPRGSRPCSAPLQACCGWCWPFWWAWPRSGCSTFGPPVSRGGVGARGLNRRLCRTGPIPGGGRVRRSFRRRGPGPRTHLAGWVT